MSFQKILLAYDGSNQSKKALDKTIELAKKINAEVIAVHAYHYNVLPPTATVGPYSVYMSDDDFQTLGKVAKTEGDRLLNEAKQELNNANIVCDTLLGEGNAAALINETAKQQQCDLIIMGSHGYGPFKELMLGSVSHKIVQLSEIPVLVIK